MIRRQPKQVRAELIAQKRLAPVAQPAGTPAPYGGLNTRDSLDAMLPNQAVVLNNWFPSEGEVSVRGGYTEAYDTGSTGNTIESMGEFKAQSYVHMVVGVNGLLFEVSTMTKVDRTTTGTTASHLIDAGYDFAANGVTTDSLVINDADGTYAGVTNVAVGDLTLDADIMTSGEDYRITTPIGTGYTEDNWDFDNFDGELMLCNGVDDPLRWNGTALSANVWTGIADDADLSVVTSFKNRLFYATGDDQSFWYADTVYAKTGVLVEFPVGRIGAIKGNVVALSAWTVDGGEGMDDYFIIATAGGQIIVYQGNDPGSSINWALVGIYNVALPLNGRNCLQKIGTDVMYLSVDDVTPIRLIMQQGYVGQRTLASGGIRSEAVDNTGYGWQMLLAPEGRQFIINLPNPGSGGGYNQYVQNTITGAWTRWVDIPSPCWEGYNGKTHFGSTDGKVYKIDGNTDNGAGIEAYARQAYSSLGLSGEFQLTAAKVVLGSDGSVNYNFGLSYEYNVPTILPSAATASSGTPWGSPWGSPWGPEELISNEWEATVGKGSKVAPILAVTAKQRITWHETEYRVIQTQRL